MRKVAEACNIEQLKRRRHAPSDARAESASSPFRDS